MSRLIEAISLRVQLSETTQRFSDHLLTLGTDSSYQFSNIRHEKCTVVRIFTLEGHVIYNCRFYLTLQYSKAGLEIHSCSRNPNTILKVNWIGSHITGKDFDWCLEDIALQFVEDLIFIRDSANEPPIGS